MDYHLVLGVSFFKTENRLKRRDVWNLHAPAWERELKQPIPRVEDVTELEGEAVEVTGGDTINGAVVDDGGVDDGGVDDGGVDAGDVAVGGTTSDDGGLAIADEGEDTIAAGASVGET